MFSAAAAGHDSAAAPPSLPPDRSSRVSERLAVHPTHPQPRLIERAARALAAGQLLLVPTDAGYAFAWALDARDAEARVQRLRALDMRHPFTVLCASLSAVGSLAILDDRSFRLVKSLVPGPFTFVLPASAALPRRLKQAKRRAVGCRIPDNVVARALLEAHGEPLLVSSALVPDADGSGESPASHDAEAVAERLKTQVDVMLDAGDTPPGASSVIDLTGDEPRLLREGRIVPRLD